MVSSIAPSRQLESGPGTDRGDVAEDDVDRWRRRSKRDQRLIGVTSLEDGISAMAMILGDRIAGDNIAVDGMIAATSSPDPVGTLIAALRAQPRSTK
jgi:hypothetical protein